MYGAIGAGAADAVPDLIAEINRPRPAYSTGLAGIASQSLGRIGPAARAALPDLEKLLTHKELGPDAALAIWLIAPDDRSLRRVEHYITPGALEPRPHRDFLEHLGDAGSAAAGALPAVLQLMRNETSDQVFAAEIAWRIGASPEAVALLKKIHAEPGDPKVAGSRIDRAALALARIDNDPDARRTIEQARFDLHRRETMPRRFTEDRYGTFWFTSMRY
jgi:hypothetical protein